MANDGVIRLTDEQHRAVDLFREHGNVAIEAGAGTGKTSTLEALARSTPRIGAYVAFNRAIVNAAARRFPMSVTCSTAHALAMRQVGRAYAHRLDTPRVKSYKLARLMDVGPVIVTIEADRQKALQPGYLAGHVLRAVRNFCHSADDVPGPEHFPYIDGIDARASDGRRTYTNNRHLAEHLADALHRTWDDICNPNGRLPFTPDHYLKIWQLGDPHIPGDFVLFDEAQDASPVMLAAVQHQQKRGAMVVYVGDSQQQIYGWRGAVNALATVPVEHRAFLTKSFRFGPAIAEVANAVLDHLNASLRLEGHEPVGSRVGMSERPNVVLTRSNSAAVSTLLAYQRMGLRPHMMGGAADVVYFARSAINLMNGERTGHPDLACFDSWQEVREYCAADPQGDDIALLVKMLDEYGPQIVLDALEGMPAEEAADVTISTAHKAKGREWAEVRLAGDFPPWKPDLPAEELRLLYVAATRAIGVLDMRSCDALNTMTGRQEVAMW